MHFAIEDLSGSNLTEILRHTCALVQKLEGADTKENKPTLSKVRF